LVRESSDRCGSAAQYENYERFRQTIVLLLAERTPESIDILEGMEAELDQQYRIEAIALQQKLQLMALLEDYA
jgi:hypothetical protein